MHEQYSARVRVERDINGKLCTGRLSHVPCWCKFLREELSLTGTHIGCDTSYCGLHVL